MSSSTAPPVSAAVNSLPSSRMPLAISIPSSTGSSPTASALSFPFTTAPSSPVLSATTQPIVGDAQSLIAVIDAIDTGSSANVTTAKTWPARLRALSKSWQGLAAVLGFATTLMVVYYTVHTYNLAAWTAEKDYCEFQRSFENTTITSQCSVIRPPIKRSLTQRWEHVGHAFRSKVETQNILEAFSIFWAMGFGLPLLAVIINILRLLRSSARQLFRYDTARHDTIQHSTAAKFIERTFNATNALTSTPGCDHNDIQDDGYIDISRAMDENAALSLHTNRSCAIRRRFRINSPRAITRVFGQIFVEYMEHPPSHVGGTGFTTRRLLNVQYLFPMSLLSTTDMYLLAAYSSYAKDWRYANVSPNPTWEFNICFRRRAPESADVIKFAMSGNIEGLKKLFLQGLATPYVMSEVRGYSLLQFALHYKQYETCIFLIKAGSDPRYGTRFGDDSPYNKAGTMILEGGITTAERKFLSFITDLNDWIEAQNFSRVHRIVANLIDADLEKELDLDPYAIDIQDATGRTPLHWAAARGNADNCRKLLNYGANLNILDIFRLSPFAYAAGRNQIACCRKLLEFGAAVDVECSRCHGVDGPLHRESHNAPHYDLAHSDFNYAAYPSAHGKYRCTPLIHAAREGQTELVLLLLSYGADTNQLSKHRPGSYLRAMDDLQIDEADEEH